MGEISSELRAAVQKHGRPDVATEAEQASRERADVLEQFPVEVWPSLPLERYALGAGGAEVPYCQLLEYRTPHLGSIKGGSARKHMIFRRRDGQWWLTAPLQGLEPHEAWERIRAEFVSAISAARTGRVEDLEALSLLRSGPALVTKTLAVYGPEYFLDVYSADHLRRFVTMFGGTPDPEAPSWVLNRQLLDLVEHTEPFSGWSREETLHFLYRHLHPRDDQPILKITPGEHARLWPACLEYGVIRVGYDDVGDLGGYPDDDALVDALSAVYPDRSGTAWLVKLARQLLRFRDLSAGTRIVANRGTSEILAVGTVTDDGYRYDPNLNEYRHLVAVDWDPSYAQTFDKPVRGWVPTFNNITAELWATITRGASSRRVPRPGGDDGTGGPPVPAPSLPRDVQRLLDALERKGQVIVHGPPGTGKTRLALAAALVLSGRPEALFDAEQRRTAIDAMLRTPVRDTKMPAVVMSTFHPSLGYEDFVEGYKPVPTQHGGLALARTAGLFLRVCAAAHSHPEQLFVLIIDEINRADLARVLGELLTLLERDKRGHVTVQLPVSGTSFSVPDNIRLIGTMNTADRSVSHLDAAVRRRFGFLEAAPDPAVLEGVVGALNLATLLAELNRRITGELGADHRLGHALLMLDDQPVDSPTALAAAFYQDIVPQLEDATIGDRAVLRRLLGDSIVDADAEQLDPEDLVLTLAKEFSADEAALHV